MRMRLIGLVVLFGCGSEPPCDFDKHTFLLHGEELSGDCGPIPDTLQRQERAADNPGCTGGPIPADGACAIGSHQTCPIDGGGFTDSKIAIHRTDDESTYEGTVDVTIRDAQGKVVCHSVYKTTYTPQ